MPTILTNSDLDWTTTFSLNTTPKKFVFEDSDPYTAASIPLSGVRGVFEITSPSGVVVYNNTTYGAGSDIVANIALFNAITIPLPNLANQAPEQGVYSVTYTVQINDGSNPIYYITETRSLDFDYESPTASIVPQVDCIQPLISVSDSTDYVVNSITPSYNRTLTLQYPANSGGATITNTTSSTITSDELYNGLQVATVSTILSYEMDTDLYVVDTVSGTKSINVDCSYVCQLYCCLKSLNSRKENARGVNDYLFQQLESQFTDCMNILELLFLAIDCGKQEDANNYISKIKQIADCSDDCSCTDGTPSRVTGLGIQNVNVEVVSGGSPITVSSNTSGGITTYTVSFSSSLVTKINNSYNTVVVAGTNITVTDSGIVNDVRTFTVNSSVSLKDSMYFRVDLTFTPPSSISISTGSIEIDGSNFQNPTVGTVATTNNLFRISGFMVTPNNNYKAFVEGVQTGVITFYSQATGLSAYDSASAQYNNSNLFDVKILNMQSDQFDFRFVDNNGNPPTFNMLYRTLKSTTLNFLIKQ